MKKCVTTILIIVSIFSLCACSNQTMYDAWYLNYMQVDKLWKCSKGESQTIAFIDTGISPELMELYKERIVSPYNVIDNTQSVVDENGHGTKIISIACGNGSYGLYGIAPECKIMPIKAVGSDGKCTNEVLAKAIDFAIENNATIINLSLGGFKQSDEVKAMIDLAIEHNITVVAAAGDYAQKDLLFPANQNNVISVEARNENNCIWEESNTSPDCIIAFPGEKIKVLEDSDGNLQIATNSGTSHATAIASGYIALVRDYYVKKSIVLSNEDLIVLLQELDTKTEKKTNYLSSFKL